MGLWPITKQVFEASKVDLVIEDEILVLDFAETLPLGLGVLAIVFEGVLNDRMKGFYRRYSFSAYIVAFVWKRKEEEKKRGIFI